MEAKMSNERLATFECGNCQHDIATDADYCTNCGGIYIDHLTCSTHGMTQANGVCVFCDKPFCNVCGIWQSNVFCCKSYSEYEIIEQMACLRTSNDVMLIDYITKNLKAHNLQPFVYKHDLRPIVFNNATVAGGVSDIIHHHNEQRIMLPFSEILIAEDILSDIESDIPGLEL